MFLYSKSCIRARKALAGVLAMIVAFMPLFNIRSAEAAIPQTINYQSRLLTPAGLPVTSTTAIQLSFYLHPTNGAPADAASQSGPLVWKEIYDQGTGVCSMVTPDSKGYFFLKLGSCNAFPAYLDFSETMYVGVKIGTDAEASPRVQLSAHPYALNAQRVNSLEATTTAAAGQLLALDNNLNFNIATGTFTGAGLFINGTSTLQQVLFTTATGTSLNLTNYLAIGAIRLDATGTNNITSGAYLVGVFDEFDNSNATTVQAALRDFDTAITAVSSTLFGMTLQQVTDNGATTTNRIQFAGATSTGDVLFDVGGDATINVNRAPNSTDGHNLYLQGGHAGLFSMAGNSGGDVIINGGAGSGFPAIPGNVILADIRGGVGIGAAVPYSKLHVDSQSASTTAIATFGNNAGDYQTFNVQNNPEGQVIASVGDIALDSSNGGMYVKVSGNSTATGWQRVFTSATGLVTLDSAYDGGGSGAGRFIITDAGPIEITNTTGTLPFMSVTHSTNAEGLWVNNLGDGSAFSARNMGSAAGFYSRNQGTGYGARMDNATNNGTGLYIDNSNNGLGMRIDNAGNNFGEVIYNSADGIGLNIQNTSSTGLGLYIRQNDGRGLVLDNNTTNRGLEINNNGTGQGIYVYNQSSERGFQMYDIGGKTGFQIDKPLNGGNAVEINTDDNARVFYISHNGNNEAFWMRNQGTGASIWIEDATTDLTPFVLNSSGYLGIGTSTPAFYLDVNGDARVAGQFMLGRYSLLPGSGYQSGSVVYNTASSTINYWDGTEWVSLLGSSASSSLGWLTTGNSGTNSATNFIGTIDNQGLAFRTNNIQNMILTATGLLGVGSGVGIPGHMLEVAGDLGLALMDDTGDQLMEVSGNLTAGTAIYQMGDVTGVDTETLFTINPAQEGFYFTDGSVGIGTTTPSTLLHVQGGLNGRAVLVLDSDDGNADGQDAGIYINSDYDFGSDAAFIEFANNGTASGKLYSAPSESAFMSYGNNPLHLYTNGSARLTVAGDGNIGISTSTPASRLEVNGTDNWMLFRAYNNDDTEGIGMGVDAWGGDLSVNYDGGNHMLVSTYFGDTGDNYDHVFLGDRHLTVRQTSGYIGFATETPAYRLDIVGDARLSGQFMLGRYASLPASGYQSGALVYRTSSSTINYWDGTQWRTVATAEDIRSSLWDEDHDTGVQVEESADEDYIRFDTAGVERMFIQNDGKIGINTTGPLTAGLQIGQGGHMNAALSINGNPGDTGIMAVRDEDGEDIFTALGSLANNDFEFMIGDVSAAYTNSYGGVTAIKLDQNNEFYSFARAPIRFTNGGVGSPDYVGFLAPSVISSSTIWTLPNRDGSSNQVLTTNGAGILSWATSSDLVENIYTSDGDLAGDRTVSGDGVGLGINTVNGGYFEVDVEDGTDYSFIHAHSDELELNVTNPSAYSGLVFNSGGTSFTHNTSGSTTQFYIGSNITFTDSLNFRGAEYAADYSANYTNRTLVDKEYVDNAITSSTVAVGNGLTLNSGVIKLGGDLTETTYIDHQGYDLVIREFAGEPETLFSGDNFKIQDGSYEVRFGIGGPSSMGISFTNPTSSYDLFSFNNNIGIITDITAFQGLVYDKDYSSYYVNRSLVDKEYVDSHISSVTMQGAADNSIAADGYVYYDTGAAFWEDDGGAFKLEADAGGYQVEIAEAGGTKLVFKSDNGVLNPSEVTFHDTRATTTGIEYYADYSADFSPRSLVDKGYVDNYLSASAGSGLTWDAVNNEIDLGGNLTGNTTINYGGWDFRIQQGSSYQMYNTTNHVAYLSDGIDFTQLLHNKDDIQISGSAGFAGATYAFDYSANYTNRSLVDKEYVDNSITSSTLLFANGLTNNLGTVVLGGSMTTDTEIDLSTYSLQFNATDGYHRIADDRTEFMYGDSYFTAEDVGFEVEAGDGDETVNYYVRNNLFEISGYTSSSSINPNFHGATYGDDYSAYFVDRSLVDKEYVDNAIVAATTTLNAAYNGGGSALGRQIFTTNSANPVEIINPGTDQWETGLAITNASNGSGLAMRTMNNFGDRGAKLYFADDTSDPENSTGAYMDWNELTSSFEFGYQTAGTRNSSYYIDANQMSLNIPGTSNNGAFRIQATNYNVPVLTLAAPAFPSSISMQMSVGTSTPESRVTANSGSVFFRTDGTGSSQQLYVKTTDVGNTGWFALAGADSNHWQKNTNVLSPTDSAVYQIAVTNNSASTLTGFKAVNTNDSNNYAGAVLELKGSGADYTNNLYFGKYGANFYVPSWAGNGVLATDKNLVIGSLGTGTLIRYQVGGGYTTPATVATLDSDSYDLQAGISLNVGGNTVLGDASSDTVTFNARVNSNVLPSVTNTYSLGSTTNRWSDVWGAAIHVGTSTWDLAQADNGSFTISEAGNGELVRILSSGNVGIGTEIPEESLVTTQDLLIGQWDGVVAPIGGHNRQLIIRAKDGQLAGIQGTAYTSYQRDAVDIARVGLDTSNNINFGHYSGSWTTNVVIATSGNMGIGDTTPSRRLDIQGSTTPGDNLFRVGGGADGGYLSVYTPSADDRNTTIEWQRNLNFHVNGSDALVIENDGDAVFAAELMLGQYALNPATGGRAGAMIYNTASSTPFFWDGSSWHAIAAEGAISLDDAYDAGGSGLGRSITADSGAVYISGAGNGTALQIDYSGSGAGFAFNHSGTGQGISMAQTGTGEALYIRQNNGRGILLENNTANDGLTVDTGSSGNGIQITNDGSSSNGMRIDNDTDGSAVYIDDTLGKASININKPSGSGDLLRMSNSGTGDAIDIINASSGRAFKLKNTGIGDSFFIEDENSDATPFVLSANGDVGIGKTVPESRLHITGDNSSSDVSLLKFQASNDSDIQSEIYFAGVSNATYWNVNSSGNGGALIFKDGTTEIGKFTNSGLIINDGSAANIDFRVESDTNTHALFVDATNGYVGFDQSTPLAKLHVGNTTAGASADYPYMRLQGSGDVDHSLYLPTGSNLMIWDFNMTGNGGAIEFRNNNARVGMFTNTGLVINDGSATGIGLRVEGDTNANLLYTDAANDRIGIGTNAPQVRFHATQSGNTVAAFDRTTNDGTIVSLRQDGVEEGTISVSVNTVSYNAFTGSHYAWTNQNIQKGILVTLTGDNRYLHDDPNSEILYGINESTQANDARILGSYLSLQEPSMPTDKNNPHLIMAVGNGEVWVADNGENVNIGDYLISSDVAGHAQKDKGDFMVSHIIAKAAESIDWSAVTTEINGVKHKKISIFFEAFDKSNMQSSLAGTSLQGGDSNAPAVDLAVGSAVFEGSITVMEHVALSRDTVGQALILVGENKAHVSFETPYDELPVITVTPYGAKRMDYGVENVSLTGFDIVIDPIQYKDTIFNWHAFGNREAKVFVSNGTTLDLELTDMGTSKLETQINANGETNIPAPVVMADQPVVTSTTDIIESTDVVEEVIEELPPEEPLVEPLVEATVPVLEQTTTTQI